MGRRFILTLATAICGWLFSAETPRAQLTEQWRVDIPANSYYTYWGFDADGNAYGMQAVWNNPEYTFHLYKVSHDGVLQWSITDTPTEYDEFSIRENWPFWVDIYGNSYIVGRAYMYPIDNGWWPCVIKYSPTGSRLYQRVAEPVGCAGVNVGDVMAWAVDSLGQIFAAGTLEYLATPTTYSECGYAMALSSDATKVAESFHYPVYSNSIISGYNVNGPRGQDMNGNYMFQFGEWIDTDPEETYAQHFVCYDKNAAVQWTAVSSPSQTSDSYWDLSNYQVFNSGNIYGHARFRTVEKYSPGFALQWSKSYTHDDTRARAENPFDESVLIYENGLPEPLVCYNADGTLRWRSSAGAPAYWQTVFGSEHDIYTVVGYANPATLVRIDYLTGETVWQGNAVLGHTFWSVASKMHIDANGAITFAGNEGVIKLVPEKFITIRDAHRDSIPNVEFDLIRVTNNPPHFDEDTLGTFTTDDHGRIKLVPVATDTFLITLDLNSDTLVVGESLKISKHVQSVPAVKHEGLLGTMYSVHLDNAQFAEDGHLFFDTLTSGNQDVILNHTELRYNLFVSVEWEATEHYLFQLEDNFRRMSNYLYDVSDGQIRLDTVHICDNFEFNQQADILILASNQERPRAQPNGIRDNLDSSYIFMPRIWWYNADATRNHTDTADTLNLTVEAVDYRSKAHEFGHYALNFFDEYLFWHPDSSIYSSNDALRCLPTTVFRYGFMDWQYESGGVMSSEMSGSFRYSMETCRNTNQWGVHHKSCWDYLESWVEAAPRGTDNLFVPILKPDAADSTERLVTNPSVYFAGPNNDPVNPNYDVGLKVHFPRVVESQAPGYSDKHVRVHHSTGGDNADVKLVNDHLTGTGTSIQQGRTSDAAGAWVVGVKDAEYQIMATKGNSYATVTPGLMRLSPQGTSTGWLYGIAEPGGTGVSRVGNRFTTNSSADSVTIELKEVSGDYPIIFTATLGDNNANYNLAVAQLFSADPTVQLAPSSGTMTSHPLSPSGEGYSSQMTENLGSSGVFTLWAVDDSASTYFVPTSYTSSSVNHSQPFIWLFGNEGQCEFKLDSVNATVSKSLILSSSYPVIRTGLDPNAVQAGRSHSLSVYPDTLLKGTNQIVIRYDDADLKLGDNLLGDESDLAVYHWVDASTGWVMIGGTVDTADDALYAPISETGVYAAFTTNIITDVEDEEHGEILPYQFELSQNYPNPFNPATTIEYSVPSRTDITIEIFNVLGQKVRTLVNESKSAGSYRIEWNGADDRGAAVSTGVYLYRFQAGDVVQTKKMLLIK